MEARAVLSRDRDYTTSSRDRGQGFAGLMNQMGPPHVVFEDIAQ